ncbi:MAG: hypothetical protein AVDCRST_MAG68-2069, partial [uncultured Gemmatimonadetes bacterium]
EPSSREACRRARPASRRSHPRHLQQTDGRDGTHPQGRQHGHHHQRATRRHHHHPHQRPSQDGRARRRRHHQHPTHRDLRDVQHLHAAGRPV